MSVICPEGSGLEWENLNFFHNDFGACAPSASRGGELLHPDSTSEGRAEGMGGTPVSRCEVFVSDREEYVSAIYASRIRERPAHRSEYQHYVDCCHELGVEGVEDVEDVEGFLSRMIVCDDLLANTDRHWRNFGLVRDAVTLECRMVPIFDSGTSLWCDKPLGDLKRGDFSFESKQFHADATRQFQLADLTWVDTGKLEVFLDEAMGILRRGRGFEERLPYIQRGLGRRLERLETIREYL